MDRKTSTNFSERRRQQKEEESRLPDDQVSSSSRSLQSRWRIQEEKEKRAQAIPIQQQRFTEDPLVVKPKQSISEEEDDAVSPDPSVKRRRLGLPREDHDALGKSTHIQDLSRDTQTQNLEKQNKCKECGKEFASGKALGGHMRVHSVKSQPKTNQAPAQKIIIHKCSECDREFPTAQVLGRHKRYSHGIQGGGGGGQRLGPSNVSPPRPLIDRNKPPSPPEAREEELDD